MILKILSIAFILFLTMLISGVVCGDEFRMPPDTPGVYKATTMNSENPNLLIGGIGQNGRDPAQNDQYIKMAEQIGAIYIPTYYTGAQETDAAEVNLAASWYNTYVYPNGLTYKPTYQNGLENNALTDETYNTIVAYSGGTVTAVTALAEQGVKCHTLILISPIRGTPYENPMIPIDPKTTLTATKQDELYKETVKGLLDSGAVQRIVIIQSTDDRIQFGGFYQAQFKEGEVAGIDVYPVDLKSSGEEAHKEIFGEYAKDHLKIGKNGRVYYSSQPISQETTPSAALAALGIGFPQLSPSTSGISWFSDQNKDGSDGLETSGATYSDKANDVWYVDAFYWSGDRNLLEKPAAPYRFASGEINTYGYNWIYLPYSRTGITFTPGYADWAVDTLASMGISIGAGVGPLDDGQVGGGLGGGGGEGW